MAVQYDSKNDSWSTWLDIFKNKIPSASEEAVSAFEKIQEQVGQGIDLDNYDNFIKRNDLADESLIAFLKDTKYAEKNLENYQLYLKNSATSMNLFQIATKKAGTALKSLGGTLASMAIMFVVTEVISIANRRKSRHKLS